MFKFESEFRTSLTDYLKQEAFSCQPIESGLTGLGIPDLFAASKRHEVSCWIEFKLIRGVISEYTAIEYRPGQFAWLTLYSTMGVLCILAVASEIGWSFFKNKDIKKGYTFDELSCAVLNEPFEIVSWMKGD